MLSLTAAGRLGKDAVLRTTQGGTDVLGFSVGTDVGYGERKKTIWVDCAIWGDRAKKLAPYLTKGQAVTVIGEPDIRTWEGQNGFGATMTLNVRELTMQGGKRDGEQSTGQQTDRRGGQGGGWEPPADLDDQVPF